MQLAEDMGIKVERRPIPEEELETFEEAGACGTKLYNKLRGIQYGDEPDTHGWVTIVE